MEDKEFEFDDTLDEQFMSEAIAEAMAAEAADEVPIGAVIVRDGVIIARAHNRREADKCATHHAEILAIEEACRTLGGWRLPGATLYVTLEPCQMCAGALVQSRIDKVFIGAMNKKAGCAGSVLDLLHVEGFNHQVEPLQLRRNITCNMRS